MEWLENFWLNYEVALRDICPLQVYATKVLLLFHRHLPTAGVCEQHVAARSEVVPFLRGVRSEEERSPSDPPWEGQSPPIPCEATPISQGDRMNSLVFLYKVVLNIGVFGQNLAGILFWLSPTDYHDRFCIWPPGGQAIRRQR